MKTSEAEVISFPVKTRLVCSGCGAKGEGSCGCGVAYVSPGFRAEEAVKANPGKSDRMIADEIGVDHKTVSKARRATGEHSPVGKRVGKDGRSRTQPKRRISPDTFSAVVRARQQGRTQAEAAKEAGSTSVQTVKIAEAYEQGRAELLEALAIDPATLAPTAQAKLEIAKRMLERKLNAEHAARMAQIDEEVRLRVVAEGREYLARLKAMEAKAFSAELQYREATDRLIPTFTESEFFVVLRALDPAIEHQLAKPNPERIKLMNDATALLNAKRERLTLKKNGSK